MLNTINTQQFVYFGDKNKLCMPPLNQFIISCTIVNTEKGKISSCVKIAGQQRISCHFLIHYCSNLPNLQGSSDLWKHTHTHTGLWVLV